jgi:hypothetical protein
MRLFHFCSENSESFLKHLCAYVRAIGVAVPCDLTMRDSSTNGSLSLTVRFFGVGVGFGGNYGRVCEMLYPRRAGTLRQKFQKIQRIFRTKSQSPKIFREIFLHKGKG